MTEDMDTIGAEVGQKMRSAIKAKLLELSCYVDDELPDYIMVMVANKRTKSQMNEDLHLFLSDKTEIFVEWLHIVLKKLKEVTVTNPEVYKRVAKRKSDHLDSKVKKEKKNKKSSNIALKPEDKSAKDKEDLNKIMENRKITVLQGSHGSENMQDKFDIPLLSEVNASNKESLVDIEQRIRNVKSRLGLLVDSDIEIELDDQDPREDISLRSLEKIKNSEVKQECKQETLKDSNVEEAPSSSVESNPDTTNNMENTESISNPVEEKRSKHKPITFEDDSPPPKKLSVLERLGKKATEISTSDFKRTRISLASRQNEERFSQCSRERSREKRERSREKRDRSWEERDRRRSVDRRDDNRKKDRRGDSREKRRARESTRKDLRTEIQKDSSSRSVLSRLGVLSKVSIPQKDLEPELENELKTREVRSMVQVKPRVIPSDVTQPNKNLLLKAVAEAHRSVALSMKSGSSKSESLLKRNPNPKNEEIVMYNTRKLPQSEKTKLRNLILSQFASENKHNSDDDDDDNGGKAEVYIPKPIRHSGGDDIPKYVPSSQRSSTAESRDGEEEEILTERVKRKFADRLEGIDGSVSRLSKASSEEQKSKPSIKSRLDRKKSKSPIIFDKERKIKISQAVTKIDVPDKLPVVHPPISLKNKERCKYWPSCRQGDKCEFVHPTTNCEVFPNCKFGESCLYIHPPCKFGSSCTKRDCVYSHVTAAKTAPRALATLQQCKYFPTCTNINCQFYHPKLCKFGRYCKNQADCPFSHLSLVGKAAGLSWRSNYT